MAERILPAAVMALETDKFPADAVPVAAVLAHCEESEDRHLANELEESRSLDSEEPGVLVVGGEIGEARGFAQGAVQFGQAIADFRLPSSSPEEDVQTRNNREAAGRQAADHQPDQKGDREEHGEAVGRHELDDDRAERPGDPGVEGADPEGQGLVERQVVFYCTSLFL